MNSALKEWAVIVQAMKEGEHHFLLRKGGLADKGQTFKLSHSKFLLFPTYEHQKQDMVLPKMWKKNGSENEPSSLTLEVWAEAIDHFFVHDLSQINELSKYHCWSESYLKMRRDYHPEKPLILVLLKTFVLEKAKKIANLKTYGGCRSWVELKEDVSLERSRPVLTDNGFNQLWEEFRKALPRDRTI